MYLSGQWESPGVLVKAWDSNVDGCAEQQCIQLSFSHLIVLSLVVSTYLYVDLQASH
jgi:hypothetical protein